MQTTQVIGGVHLRVRTCARVDLRFTKVNDGAYVHVAPFFRISGTAARIAPKLGVWLEDH